MNKEKKIKVSIIIVSSMYFMWYAMLHIHMCSYERYLDGNYDYCGIMIYQDSVLQPIATVVIVMVAVSILTFFISDKIFKKWLIFTPFYLLLTAFLVYKVPVSAGGALGIGPTKELVSIWMGILFAIISTIMFIWMSVKEKKNR